MAKGKKFPYVLDELSSRKLKEQMKKSAIGCPPYPSCPVEGCKDDMPGQYLPEVALRLSADHGWELEAVAIWTAAVELE